MRRKHRRVLKGAAAGLVGGLVASWTMNQFQSLWSKLASPHKSSEQDPRSKQQSGMPVAQTQPIQQSKEESAPATLKLAKKISEPVLRRPLTKEEENIAEPLVHYTYGAVWGGIYGAAAELDPRTTTVLGLPFGAALWALGDELAVPALGLAKWPTEYPVSSHLQALAAHAVYGITTDVVRRGILKAIR